MGASSQNVAVVTAIKVRADLLASLGEYYPIESRTTILYHYFVGIADITSDIDIERAATVLDAGIDEARDDALFPNFGHSFDLQKRGDLGWTWAQYRATLKSLNEAFTLYGGTTHGVRKVIQAVTGVSPIILEHYKYAGWILDEHALGTTAIVQTGDFIWSTISNMFLSTVDINSIWAMQHMNMWMCGLDAGGGQVWFSDNAGAGINTNMSAPTALTYHGIHSFGPNEVWACGSAAGGGIISHYHHMDGWDSNTASFVGSTLRKIWMSSLIDGLVIGDAGTSWHWDGNTWTTVVTGTGNTLFGLRGSSPTNIFTAGANGTVLHWNGTTWADVSTVAVSDWQNVYVVDTNNIWVCGLLGYIYTTADGGITWGGPGVVDAAVSFSDIWVSSDNQTIRAIGTDAGGDGRLFYSTDSGATWSSESFQGGIGNGFSTIVMAINETMGFIGGPSGTLLRRNGQSPGYILNNGTEIVNGELVYGAILESRLGRQNSADVIVWDIPDYDLLWRLLNEIKPAHIKLFLVREVPWASGYYYYDNYDTYSGALSRTTFSDSINYGIIVNGRPYGEFLSRIVTNEAELHIPQLT